MPLVARNTSNQQLHSVADTFFRGPAMLRPTPTRANVVHAGFPQKVVASTKKNSPKAGFAFPSMLRVLEKRGGLGCLADWRGDSRSSPSRARHSWLSGLWLPPSSETGDGEFLSLVRHSVRTWGPISVEVGAFSAVDSTRHCGWPVIYQRDISTHSLFIHTTADNIFAIV